MNDQGNHERPVESVCKLVVILRNGPSWRFGYRTIEKAGEAETEIFNAMIDPTNHPVVIVTDNYGSMGAFRTHEIIGVFMSNVAMECTYQSDEKVEEARAMVTHNNRLQSDPVLKIAAAQAARRAN